jgi:hypothetical protein
MSGQPHFELDASMKLFTELAAVDSFSSCTECYQRHKDMSSSFTGD